MFSKISIISVFLALFVCVKAQCTSKERRKQIKPAYRVFLDKANDPLKAAQFIRAGFHDCATATSSDPLSGCNGSLKFELPAGEGDLNDPFFPNLRLKEPMIEIEAVQAIYNCLSLADTILIAYAAGSTKSKASKRDLLATLVSEDIARVDRGAADFSQDFLDLPDARVDTFEGQMQFYRRKNFNERDFVVSLVVGHSVGGFAPPAQSSPVLPFTEPSIHKVNGDYCGALLAARELVFGPGRSDVGNVALPRFNFLPSDFSISESQTGRDIMKEYCAIDIPDRTNYALKFTENKAVYQADWETFSIKMSQLTGQALADMGL